MAGKRTIYFSNHAENIIGDTTGNLSGRLTSILTRYSAVISQECPAFTESEWLAICEVINDNHLSRRLKKLSHYLFVAAYRGCRGKEGYQ